MLISHNTKKSSKLFHTAPCSLLPAPCSLFPVPCSLFPKTHKIVPHEFDNCYICCRFCWSWDKLN
ncbi:hypothetical protein [Moorena sp. SIO4A5]|uniref:hypothetical protein n=1 Tax=Moorena sp. SIO4A5 TaxID=2607838 RepID=UPI0013C5B8DD|nr:hypothetical protein [Moorena sp. SIO4A5]NEO24708.1 hypothetical protein [Moorena sp. SIO4A5]